jgi:hypothetical protein
MASYVSEARAEVGAVLVGLAPERDASGGGAELGAEPGVAPRPAASEASFAEEEQALAALSSALAASP